MLAQVNDAIAVATALGFTPGVRVVVRHKSLEGHVLAFNESESDPYPGSMFPVVVIFPDDSTGRYSTNELELYHA